MSSAKTSRWLDLIAFLLSHRFPVTREEIFAKVAGYDEGETTRRMFERDKDELRALGIEIETVPIPDAAGDEPASGYRLRPGAFYLPYLELHEDRTADRPYQGLKRIQVSRADLAMLDRATQLVAQRSETRLGRAAASARRKLEFDLPLPQSAVERVLTVPLEESTVLALEVLQRAVAEHTAVTCRYHSIGRNTEEARTIEPYGLFFNWGRWYCVARARDRNALRVFRLDRMQDAKLEKGKEASFDVPEGFSIENYVGRAPWELSGGTVTTVRVQFAFPESRWVLAQRVGKVIEPLLDDGGAVLDFAVQDLNPFLRWLLTFRGHAQILSPEDVVRQLVDLREKVARRYV